MIDSDFDIRQELWFRPQIRFIRAAKPHILLRQENLESEIQIIRRLIPEYYVGLSRVNSSSDRPEQGSITNNLNPNQLNLSNQHTEMILDSLDIAKAHLFKLRDQDT